MDKHPRTLPDDIYAILDESADHVVSEANVIWAAEVFADLLRTRLQKRKEKRGEEVLRFSALGKPDRQLWYQANMPEIAEKMPPKAMLKFMYGDLIEVLMLFLAKESGHEVTDLQLGVECDGVKGSIDAMIDGVLVDVKSASPFAFEKFVSGNYLFDDPFGYVKQLGGYANALDKTEAGFLVAQKVDGSVAFVSFDEMYIKGNPPAPRIAEQRAVVNNPEPPPRCYPTVPEGKSGNMKLGIGCSYCVVPGTKIFMSDLTWKNAEDVEKGDALVGFNGPHKTRMLHTEATHTRRIIVPTRRVITEVGEIIVSHDHLFVSTTPHHELPQWRNPDQLKPGYHIKYFGAPWETEESDEAGYLRGFLDGEGYFGNHKLAYSQNQGPVLDLVNRLMDERGYDQRRRYTKNDAGCQTVRLKGSFYESYRAVGSLRPIRLLPKAMEELGGLAPRSYLLRPPRVLAIEDAGVQEVIAITTASETLITNGFFSHNCPFKNECYKDSNKGRGLKTYAYSRGPVFLSTVVKEPRVSEA